MITRQVYRSGPVTLRHPARNAVESQDLATCGVVCCVGGVSVAGGVTGVDAFRHLIDALHSGVPLTRRSFGPQRVEPQALARGKPSTQHQLANRRSVAQRRSGGMAGGRRFELAPAANDAGRSQRPLAGFGEAKEIVDERSEEPTPTVVTGHPDRASSTVSVRSGRLEPASQAGGPPNSLHPPPKTPTPGMARSCDSAALRAG